MTDSVLIADAPSQAFILAQSFGIKGDTGAAGLSGASFVFNQMSASQTWVINHNLGRFPSVTVVDSSGTRVYGQEQYIDSNNVTITFTSPFSGQAFLN